MIKLPLSAATQTVSVFSLNSSVYCNVFGAFNENQYNFSQESVLILAEKKEKNKVGDINKVKNIDVTYNILFLLKNRRPFL